MSAPKRICAYCERPAQGKYGIHETEEGMWNGGPEVDLCDDCGGESEPSCPEIWAVIAARKAGGL